MSTAARASLARPLPVMLFVLFILFMLFILIILIMLIPVTSADDPRLADYAQLRDRDLARDAEGLFVGEQILIVERMLSLPGVVRSVLVGEPFLRRVQPLVADAIPLYVGPMKLLEALAGFAVHRGVLAIGDRAALARPDLAGLAGPSDLPRTLLLCEEITHVDNIGQLFRTAAAFAVDGVLLSPGCHDPLYRRAVRVSVGHSLTMPWTRSDQWLDDLRQLKARHGFRLLGAALSPQAVPLDELPAPPRCAVVVGTEFAGLAPATLELCDAIVRIPMAAGVDSLNVAVATAVCLHRFSRGTRR